MYISERGKALAKEGDSWLKWRGVMIDNLSASNPDGFANIGVAENSLMVPELVEYYQSKFRVTGTDFNYPDNLCGTSRLLAAAAEFLNEWFHPHKSVLPDHIVTGSGVSPVLNQLVRLICDPGEGILIAAPYYRGFDADIRITVDAIPIPVSVPRDVMFTMGEIDSLEKSLKESREKGVNVRAVILCNPHNPLGAIYDRNVVIAYAKFCEKHDLHLISDEIYALSVFPNRDRPNPKQFVSVLSIDMDKIGVDPRRVHVLYGMSKDFNANGFRIGIFVSQYNKELLEGLLRISFFMAVSSLADSLWSCILRDRKFLRTFVSQNQAKLKEAYKFMTDWLKFHNIAYTPSNAGHFLMVNFQKILMDDRKYGSILNMTDKDGLVEREAALENHLVANKVFVGSGAAVHYPEGGWFRFSFAVRRDVVRVALRRIEKALQLDSWPGLKSSDPEDYLKHDLQGEGRLPRMLRSRL